MDKAKLIKLVILGIALVGVYYVYITYYTKTTETFEDSPQAPQFNPEEEKQHVAEPFEGAPSYNVQPAQAYGSNEVYHTLETAEDAGQFTLKNNQYPSDCFPKDQLTPGELLPTDSNSKWSQAVPSGQGELGDQNFLTSGYHVGVNTVGQSLRNANRQLRSEPPNPQVKVSPWLQTTIDPDINRRPLEIGGCE